MKQRANVHKGTETAVIFTCSPTFLFTKPGYRNALFAESNGAKKGHWVEMRLSYSRIRDTNQPLHGSQEDAELQSCKIESQQARSGVNQQKTF